MIETTKLCSFILVWKTVTFNWDQSGVMKQKTSTLTFSQIGESMWMKLCTLPWPVDVLKLMLYFAWFYYAKERTLLSCFYKECHQDWGLSKYFCTGLFQAWYNERHQLALQLDTGLNFHWESQSYEKDRACTVVRFVKWHEGAQNFCNGYVRELTAKNSVGVVNIDWAFAVLVNSKWNSNHNTSFSIPWVFRLFLQCWRLNK